MPMVSDDLATGIADNMKSNGLFDIPTVEGKEFSQVAYDLTLINLKETWGVVVAYFKSNMDVVNVATTVSTTVAPGIPVTTAVVGTVGTGATTVAGTGSGKGTQSGTGSVL